jgi:hypothetical protein
MAGHISAASSAFSIAARTRRSGMTISRTLAPGWVTILYNSDSGLGGSDFHAAICRT